MRIALIGQAAFGEAVLKRFLEQKEEVAAVFCPSDPPGAKNPMKELAQGAGIPVYQPRRMREPEVSEIYGRLSPDLNVLAFVTDIIPLSILHAPRHGSIQYHPSLLPRHRGKSAINWAVIQGARKTGLSIFWVDEGIDTGPILLQKEVEIGPEDTTGSLYFNRLFPLGVDALAEAVVLVKAGKAPKIVQNEADATYEPPCEGAHGRIDWKKPSLEVYNLIRGCDPQPGAYGMAAGQKLSMYATTHLPGHSAAAQARPGEILDVTEEGILVAGQGGAFLLRKVRPEGGGKVDGAAYAKSAGLAKGAILS